MKKTLLFLIFLIFSWQLKAQTKKLATKPKLVVGIVIDQMRYDYLYRFNSRFTKGGFQRLMQDGFNCHQTFITYLPSVTAVGHSIIYTGSVPAFTGIVGNDWYDNTTHKNMYCVDDDSVESVGSFTNAGKMSPKNLWVTTITDELRLACNFKNKTIAISLKDRGSILPGGHTSNASYWMDDSAGNFISSTYYFPEKKLPNWVTTFNNKNIAQHYLSNNWNTLYPINTYTQSTVDDNNFEGKYKFYKNDIEKTTTFPHLISHSNKVALIKSTPFGNSISLDFAKEPL